MLTSGQTLAAFMLASFAARLQIDDILPSRRRPPPSANSPARASEIELWISGPMYSCTVTVAKRQRFVAACASYTQSMIPYRKNMCTISPAHCTHEVIGSFLAATAIHARICTLTSCPASPLVVTGAPQSGNSEGSGAPSLL